MKRRYTILFFIALTPLIGLSWLASKIGSSMWDMFNIHLVGMLMAAGVAAYAAEFGVNRKWPAVVALVGSMPMTWQMAQILGSYSQIVEYIGPSAILIVSGSLVTTAAAAVIAWLPVPPPPREPQVALARVVD